MRKKSKEDEQCSYLAVVLLHELLTGAVDSNLNKTFNFEIAYQYIKLLQIKQNIVISSRHNTEIKKKTGSVNLSEDTNNILLTIRNFVSIFCAWFRRAPSWTKPTIYGALKLSLSGDELSWFIE